MGILTVEIILKIFFFNKGLLAVLYLAVLIFCFSYKIITTEIKKVVYTKRCLRIVLSTYTAFFISTYLICRFISAYFIGVSLAVFLSPVIFIFGYLVFLPYDKIKFNKSIKKCKEKLKASSVKKIGITGSFGKTTTKDFLYAILSKLYKTVKTPKSYNTPLGICLSVNNLNFCDEYFVCEMGARRKGDIEFLSDIVCPNVAIITGVCLQHAETLGDIEDIKHEKNQLIEKLDGDGYAIFSSDNKYSVDMYEKAKCKKFLAGRNGGIVYVDNVKESDTGTEFDIVIDGKRYPEEVGFLGRHFLTDLCLAVACAYLENEDIDKILFGISSLTLPSHRLNVYKTTSGITVLDDGYNANCEGVKEALSVLKLQKGKKTVITPGIVELGKYERQENENLGREISLVADYVIAVGKNSKYIKSGIQATDKVCFEVSSLEEAKTVLKRLIKSGDAVLFINDLPDKYGN